MKKIEIWFDGSCHNKKNGESPMGYGVIMKIDGEAVEKLAGSPPFSGTSNVSEWVALLMAFNMAEKRLRNADFEYTLTIYGDSQIIVNQCNEKWQIHQDRFKIFFIKVNAYRKRLRNVKVLWIRRTFNVEADELSKIGRKQYQNGESCKIRL